MILVTTGTNAPAFDRLLTKVDELGLAEEVVVQHGPSSVRPAGATCVDYVSFDEFVELVRRARIVVTHAGVGSILTCLMNGKRPVVVPRLARLGEHVDNHQLELSDRLSTIGVVKMITDVSELDGILPRDAAESNGLSVTIDPIRLSRDLSDYLRKVVGNTDATA